jgi:tetratricopeptide (TPR) repeat protein
LKRTVETILRDEHVALIGPGGIGKSSLAKALLHEDAIVRTYGTKRYFVTYDGMQASTMSHQVFINHIAKTLELSVRTRRAVLAHLQSKKCLLVLDNAETFLEAAGEDSGRIPKTIAELGDLTSVRLVFTTRSNRLPSNLYPCTRIDVPGLGKDAARSAFMAVYPQIQISSSPSAIDALLSSLDFHPLSINILASVANQNKWSLKDLLSSWDQQQSNLLQIGPDKLQSLACTLELSINSLEFQEYKKATLDMLRAIAFFPKGIHRKDLHSLPFSTPDVAGIANALCRCSLTYQRGDKFITMLAPIRIYIMDTYNKDLSYEDDLLSSIRNYYCKQLCKHPDHSVRQNYRNLEHLFTFDLSSPTCRDNPAIRLETLNSTRSFLRALFIHNPRPVEILQLLLSVSEETDSSLKRTKSRASLRSIRLKKDIVVSKGDCLLAACRLTYKAGIAGDKATSKVLEKAKAFCREEDHVSHCSVTLSKCLNLSGLMYTQQGWLALAQRDLEESVSVLSPPKPEIDEAATKLLLSRLATRRGSIAYAKSLAFSARDIYKSKQITVGTINALSCLAYISIEERDFGAANTYTQKAMKLDHQLRNPWRLDLLRILADIRAREGNVFESNALLDEIIETTQTQHTLVALQSKAWNEAQEGRFDSSRALLAKALCFAAKSRYLDSSLISGYIELFAGNLSRAKSILIQLVISTDEEELPHFLAMTLRALGEVELRQKDFQSAREHFERAFSLCLRIEIPPKCLYAVEHLYHTLPDRYNGWAHCIASHL